MSTRAQPAAPLPRPRPREDQRPRPRPRPAPRSRPASRRRPSGILLLPIVAILLGGIVWINVAKLDLVRETDSVIEQSRAVQVETVNLRGQVEQGNGSIAARAEKQLGMFAVPGEEITYLSTKPSAP